MGKELNFLDIEELAAHLCGFDINDEYEKSDIDEKLMEKYSLDLSYFCDLLKDLSPLLDMAVSPITEEFYIGFGDGNMWIAKKPYKNFISTVLNWMEAKNIQDGKSRALERVVTKSGKPEFKLLLMKADQEYKLLGLERKEVSNG